MTPNIEFREIHIPKSYGEPINKVFYVLKNGRSIVMERFRSLSDDVKDDVKDIICKMATYVNYQSPKIRHNLKKYNYGEIKPKPHRFFFFKKCGNNIIFFSYTEKKTDSLADKIYKELNKEKEIYEKEFEKFIQGC